MALCPIYALDPEGKQLHNGHAALGHWTPRPFCSFTELTPAAPLLSACIRLWAFQLSRSWCSAPHVNMRLHELMPQAQFADDAPKRPQRPQSSAPHAHHCRLDCRGVPPAMRISWEAVSLVNQCHGHSWWWGGPRVQAQSKHSTPRLMSCRAVALSLLCERRIVQTIPAVASATFGIMDLVVPRFG